MEDWIRRFPTINQNHPDTSDYERFFISAKTYLEKNPSIHTEASRILLDALERFENKSLISIVYRLLNSIQCDDHVPSATLQQHFLSHELRRYIFPLIPRYDLNIFDTKLLELLHDPFYECKHFFQLMKSRKQWIIHLLEIEDKALARKQMMAIIHTRIFHNLSYFLRYFGSRDRSLSFLAFETFSLFVDGMDGSFHEEKLFKVFRNSKRSWMTFRTPLEVECTANFLIHFVDFIPCDVLGMVARNEVCSLEALLREYIVLKSPLVLPHPRWLLPPAKTEMHKMEFEDEEVCFEYLFDGHTHKDMMDCIEF